MRNKPRSHEKTKRCLYDYFRDVSQFQCRELRDLSLILHGQYCGGCQYCHSAMDVCYIIQVRAHAMRGGTTFPVLTLE